MIYILERWLECERRRLNRLRRKFIAGRVPSKDVLDAHKSIEGVHEVIARHRAR